MVQIGQFNQLTAVKEVSFGLYLDGDDWGEILLPNKYVPKGTKLRDVLDVFIHFDSEDRIIATTKVPYILYGNCGCLKVIDTNRVGAFLDWGLDKDLLAPNSEQNRPMIKDRSYIVFLKQDAQGRLIACSKLDQFLDKRPSYYKQGDVVNLLIADSSEMGTKVIINDAHWGLIHSTDTFQRLQYGKRMTGFIKTIRNDGKIDVDLRKMGHDSINELAARIVMELNKNGGFLALHDKSPIEDIKRLFGESKKRFKSAIGFLYKQNMIDIELSGIRLREKKNDN